MEDAVMLSVGDEEHVKRYQDAYCCYQIVVCSTCQSQIGKFYISTTPGLATATQKCAIPFENLTIYSFDAPDTSGK